MSKQSKLLASQTLFIRYSLISLFATCSKSVDDISQLYKAHNSIYLGLSYANIYITWACNTCLTWHLIILSCQIIFIHTIVVITNV